MKQQSVDSNQCDNILTHKHVDRYLQMSPQTRYLTQGEVAVRFRVSQSTVINWRKKRLLDYFQAPGSTKVLYSVTAVEEFERRSLHKVEEVIKTKGRMRKSPEISTKPEKEWRI